MFANHCRPGYNFNFNSHAGKNVNSKVNTGAQKLMLLPFNSFLSSNVYQSYDMQQNDYRFGH